MIDKDLIEIFITDSSAWEKVEQNQGPFLIILPIHDYEKDISTYETFCKIVKHVIRQSKRAFIFIPKRSNTFDIEVLILKEWLKRNNLLQEKFKNNNLFLVSDIHYRSVQVKHIKIEILSEIVELILNYNIEKEKISPYVPEEIASWFEDPQKTFDKYFNLLISEIEEFLKNENFYLNTYKLIQILRNGETEEDIENFINVLQPDALFQNEEFNSNFGNKLTFSSNLLNTFKNFKFLIPSFYKPNIKSFRVDYLSFEEDYNQKDPPFPTDFWKGEINNIVSRIQNIINYLETERERILTEKWIRRILAFNRLNREVTRQLIELNEIITEAWQKELNQILELPNFYFLHPKRSEQAYREVLLTAIHGFLELLNYIWGLRHFLGFPIPRQWYGRTLPSVFFIIKNPFRITIRTLRSLLTFLNFYYTLFYVLREFRRLLKDFEKEALELNSINLKGYSEHTENVKKELELYSLRLQEEFDFYFKNFQLKRFPLKEYLIKEEKDLGIKEIALKIYKNDIEPLILPKIENEIKKSRIVANRFKKFSSFVPLNFHFKEAYEAAENMVEEFNNYFFSKIQKEEYDILKENSEKLLFILTSISIRPIENLKYLWIKPILEWKRKIIKQNFFHIEHDIFKIDKISNSKENIKLFIKIAKELKFFKEIDNKIGLTEEVFYFMDKVPYFCDFYKIKYFQTKEGVPIKKLDFLPSLQRTLISQILKNVYPDLDQQQELSEQIIDVYLSVEEKNLKRIGFRYQEDIETFALKDVIFSELWEVFGPQNNEDVESRFFEEFYLMRDLNKNRDEFLFLCNLFLNFVLIREGYYGNKWCKEFFCKSANF